MTSLPTGPGDGRVPSEPPAAPDWRAAQVPPPGAQHYPGSAPYDPGTPPYEAGALPSQTQSQPGWQPLVPQTSDARRAVRLVVAGLLVAGWLRGTWHVSEHAFPGLSLAWSFAGFAGLATLILLIGGPQPRLATKWAWFWLLGIGPLSLAFLLLEPVPVWQREALPARNRLTGGWGFVIALVAGLVGSALHGVGGMLLSSWGWHAG